MPQKVDNQSVLSVNGKKTDSGWEKHLQWREEYRANLARMFPDTFRKYRDLTDKYDRTFDGNTLPGIVPGGGEFNRKRKGKNMPAKTTSVISFNSISGKRGRTPEFPDNCLPDWEINVGENLDITDDILARMEVENLSDVMDEENKENRKNCIDAFRRVLKRANGDNATFEFGIADTDSGSIFVVVRGKDSAKK